MFAGTPCGDFRAITLSLPTPQLERPSEDRVYFVDPDEVRWRAAPSWEVRSVP